ncbi:MAG: hypothetical protein ACLPQY_00650 [Streptosporangiaceae bacterium]
MRLAPDGLIAAGLIAAGLIAAGPSGRDVARHFRGTRMPGNR